MICTSRSGEVTLFEEWWLRLAQEEGPCSSIEGPTLTSENARIGTVMILAFPFGAESDSKKSDPFAIT